MSKIRKEIGRHDNFSNILMLTKNEASFDQVVDEFYDDSIDIVKFFTFGVMPFGFAINYLVSLDREDQLMKFMEQLDVKWYPEANIETAPSGLKTVVIHEGEEKYFVNMLNNDLTNLTSIKDYRKDSYELDGRRVLVANMGDTIPEILSDIHHVDFLNITGDEIRDYFRNYKVID